MSLVAPDDAPSFEQLILKMETYTTDTLLNLH